MQFQICLIGGTGAIGKEIVRQALKDSKVDLLCLLIRKKLPEWEKQDQNLGDWSKVQYKIRENFDNLDDLQDDQDIKKCKIFICTLGTRVKTGDENFIKVDYQYPLNFAKLAQKLQVQYFGLLTSQGADKNSIFLYMRTKGKVEEDIEKLNLNRLHIYQPGLLVDRDNDYRIGEHIAKYIPFIPKIESKELGKIILNHPIQIIQNNNQIKFQRHSNQDLKNMNL